MFLLLLNPSHTPVVPLHYTPGNPVFKIWTVPEKTDVFAEVDMRQWIYCASPNLITHPRNWNAPAPCQLYAVYEFVTLGAG
jgi:hypothetical protein